MPRLPTVRGRGPTALAALAAGALAAFAHPPFGVLPGLLGYAILLWSLDSSSVERPLRSAFWRGWLAGLAYFFIGVWWVTEAFMVDAENQAWMAPFAIVLLASALAAFWGVAAVIYRWARPAGWTRLLVFAGALSLLEWLLGHPLFPWNLPGETWRAGSAPSQFASVVGAYGMTWITLAIAAAPALLLERATRKTALWINACALAALVLLYGYGIVRLSRPVQASGPLVRVVQANVAQSAKYDEAYFRDIVQRYVGLTARPAAETPDIVIWPEGAIPAAVEDYLAPGTWTREAILAALKPGQTLIVGGYRVAGTNAKPIYYNSLFVLRRTTDGIALEAVYDKHRLVPFGEYLPAEDLMTKIGFKQLVHVGDGFSAGPRPHPIAGTATPAFLPLICYESLFPGYSLRTGPNPARWIANLSNDAWFGRTSGPWQHLNLASYRAIEEGLPMVRATPTGVSAVIDGYGRIRSSLGLGAESNIDARLPNSLPTTPYSRFGDFPFWLLCFLSGSLAVRQIVPTRKTS
ncbi:MAG TPA: apolipoprotein N-acyltransferase [Caulobacteraceae bacterium]|nr:apolipoprotein N-acyltransferase [Caulobacteraceae bacterium]